MPRFLPTIAITLGDPAGIGPEVVAKTLRDPRLPKGFRFEVLGRKAARIARQAHARRPAVRARGSADAAQGCRTGKYAAMVTGPVHKEALARIEPDFVGQTEFLARACGLPDDAAVMCLTDPKLTVALCTQSLFAAGGAEAAHAEADYLCCENHARFPARRGIAKPRLAFAGVNPHLGEGGLFGDEDLRIVAPALIAAHTRRHPRCACPRRHRSSTTP